MKKIILAMLFVSVGFFASAAAPSEKTKIKKGTIVKKIVNGKPQWQINFSCDGGNTWGTFCCFNTESQAQSFWNQNSAMLCGWT